MVDPDQSGDVHRSAEQTDVAVRLDPIVLSDRLGIGVVFAKGPYERAEDRHGRAAIAICQPVHGSRNGVGGDEPQEHEAKWSPNCTAWTSVQRKIGRTGPERTGNHDRQTFELPSGRSIARHRWNDGSLTSTHSVPSCCEPGCP